MSGLLSKFGKSKSSNRDKLASENVLANQERRVRRAIEQVGQQQVRSGFDRYISDLSVRETNSTCKAYLQDHGIVYKWDEMALIRQLILLHPQLSKPQTDEEMIRELKTFLKIA